MVMHHACSNMHAQRAGAPAGGRPTGPWQRHAPHARHQPGRNLVCTLRDDVYIPCYREEAGKLVVASVNAQRPVSAGLCHAPMLGVSQCMPTPEGIARSHTSTQPLPTFARCVGIAEQQLGCHHAWRHNVHAHPAAACAALCRRHLSSERVFELWQRSLRGTVGGIARRGVAPAARKGGGR